MRGNWLINCNRSEINRFTKNRADEDDFSNYIFIDDWKIIGVLGKELPLLQNREELKIKESIEIWKRLIARGWSRDNLFD